MNEHQRRTPLELEATVDALIDGRWKYSGTNIRLDSVIDVFRQIGRDRGWHTQRGAFQMCGDASEAFHGFARGLGLDADIACFNGLPPEAVDAIGRFGKPSLIDEEGTGHVVVSVDGVYVDWTARQFYPCKAFPTIWTLDELHAAGWHE